MDEEQLLKDIDRLKTRALLSDKPQEYSAYQVQADQLLMNMQISAQLQEQAENEKKRLQQEKELAEDKKLHDIAMEQVKHEHDREMMLLKIFDDVSIPLGVYEKFEKNLLNGGYIKPESKEKYLKLVQSLAEITSAKTKEIKKVAEILQSDLSYPNNEVKYTEKYKKLEGFINGKLSITDFNDNEINIIKDNQEIRETFNKTKKTVLSALTALKVLIPINIIIGIIGLIVSIKILIDINMYITFLWPILSFGTVLFTAFNNKAESSRTGELKQELNKALISQIANEYSQDNISEEEKSINEEMKKIQTEINESSKTIIDKRLQDLYTFRLEHYNLKIEKLFYDVGLVDKCMAKNYKWLDIDKKNIKSEGTYEDYFHYFNNYNPDNEELQGK